MFYKWQKVVLIDYMISWTVSWKLPIVIQPLINSPRQSMRREFMFPSVSECRQSLSEFMSDFPPHGYEVIGSIAPDID